MGKGFLVGGQGRWGNLRCSPFRCLFLPHPEPTGALACKFALCSLTSTDL